MAGYEGTVDQFTTAHKDVVSTKEGVEGTLKTLFNQLGELESAWRGTAKTSFDALMARFNDDAIKLNRALEGIGEQLLAAGSSYRESEESQQDSFSKITGALG